MIDGTSMLMSLFYSFYGSEFVPTKSLIFSMVQHIFMILMNVKMVNIYTACIEDKFYKEMLDKLEITDEKFSKQFSKDIWPELKSKLGESSSQKIETNGQ